MIRRVACLLAGIALVLGLIVLPGPRGVSARDAAFADPGMITGKPGASGGDAIVVEPKAEIETGETVVGESRRTTLYFVNKTNSPVEVVGVTTNDDLNVKSSIASNDCSLEGKILPSSRCSVVVETTPTNTGSWTAEVLLTHKGSGRIARAKMLGKASSQSAGDRKEAGFTLSTKDVKPIDFGEVSANEARVVRTALMINDSPENIVLISIDVIAAENGLERLEQGCIVDMELRPGESCPVTLLWRPVNKGLISTDLIIRHTGKLGFAVIPIRGIARDAGGKEPSNDNKGSVSASADQSSKNASRAQTREPSAAEDIEKTLANGIPALTSDTLPKGILENAVGNVRQPVFSGTFKLIGTVGSRAVMLKPDGSTVIAGIGEEINYGDGKTIKITNVSPKSVEIFDDGKKRQIVIGAAEEITSRASASSREREAPKGSKPYSGKGTGAPGGMERQ